MKDASRGNKGFSTIEIIIALGFMVIVATAVTLANFGVQYWVITSETNSDALYKAKTELEDMRATSFGDFYGVNGTAFHRINDATCAAGGLCYYLESTVTNTSECSKFALARVSWKVPGYPTTTTALPTTIASAAEAIALGGDCELAEPQGTWSSIQQVGTAVVVTSPSTITGLDVLQGKIYLSTDGSPYMHIYSDPVTVGSAPALVSYANGFAAPYAANSLDAAQNSSDGRKYVYLAQSTTSPQVLVVDVSDSANPTIVNTVVMAGANKPSGSFPQTWIVKVYKNRLYVTTRDTSGYEFHIFNIDDPTNPTEAGSGFELTRTVTDFVVREQVVSGVTHRYAFLVARAGTKEISVLDVTGDSISETASVDLSGSQDMLSVFVSGNTLYAGRASNTSGPEVYTYDIATPANLASSAGATYEIGTGVSSIRISGAKTFFTTTNGRVRYRPSTFSGTEKTFTVAGVIARSLDMRSNWIYAASATNLYVLYGN